MVAGFSREQLRDLIRRHGRIRVRDRGIPDDLLFDWRGLIGLIEDCIAAEARRKVAVMEGEFVRKVCLARNVEYGYDIILPVGADGKLPPSAAPCVQISQVVTVEFPPLSQWEVIDNQLAALAAEELAVMLDFEAKMERIKTARGQLLALPVEVGHAE